MSQVALLGYSGHAYVAAEVLLQAGYEIIGYFDKEKCDCNPYDLNYLGSEFDPDFKQKANGLFLFVSIGDNKIRRKVLELIIANDLKLLSAISSKANISSSALVGLGTLICQGACVSPFAKLGFGTILNTGAILEHESIVGDYSHIAPGAVLAGNVRVGDNCFIGANSVIKQGVTIGNNVVVGAGTVVLNDIPENEIWVGNPARKVKK